MIDKRESSWSKQEKDDHLPGSMKKKKPMKYIINKSCYKKCFHVSILRIKVLGVYFMVCRMIVIKSCNITFLLVGFVYRNEKS